MKKNIFETVEINFQSFADVIATSGAYDGLNGTYDTEGNWVTFENDNQ